MKHTIIALALTLAAAGSFARTPAAAAPAASTATELATATQPGTPQRNKMKTCNADAKTKDLHGPDRRAFMKQCLSGKAAKPAVAS